MSSHFPVARIGRLWPKKGWLATDLGKRIVLGVALVILMAIPLSVRVIPLGFDEGTPAPRTFRAPRSIQYVDRAATEALQQSAADAVQPIYIFDDKARMRARQGIVEFFATVSSLKQSAEATVQSDFVYEEYGSQLESATIEAVLDLPPPSVDVVARNVETLVSGILSARIAEGDLASARAQLAASAELVPLTLAERYAVISVGSDFLSPTFVVDSAATERLREEALERVSPVVTVVQEGQNIVERGDIVSADDVELIRTLGGLDQGVDAASVIAGIVLMTLLIVTAGGYIAAYERATWNRMRDLLLLSTLLLGMAYATRLTGLLAPEVSPYVMPVPLAAVFATILIGAGPAIVLTVLTTVAALLLGFSGGVQVVASMLASMAAIVGFVGITHRRQLFTVGAFLVGLLGVVSFGASLASGATFPQSLGSGAYGLIGGGVTAVLMIALLPVLEYLFGITSDVSLLELANPGHPLMKRLMTEAPGTYSHSVMTANLAETAAEAIGANPLLARAGAYFHDVGKLARPQFFVENQAGGSNPHDQTAPSLSARLITAHVREGVALAQEHRVPPEVVQIIREHHGDSIVSYFYDKATKEGQPVLEADFRYDGKRPSSREAALVMLADAAEAAARTVHNPTPDRIAEALRDIVRSKMDDGQLDVTSLTLKDLETIVAVYSRILASVYHPRIAYPPVTQGRGRYGSQNREPQGS